jgi:hypothetical protein
LVNSLGMAFALVPSGTFVMGSPPQEPLRGQSEIQHFDILRFFTRYSTLHYSTCAARWPGP